MKDLRVKLRRQAELLCKVLSSDEKLTTTDLAFEFGCEELTIKRDMQELRAREIDIHSKASKGVEIDSAISDEKLKEIISGYFAITVEEDNYNKATALLVKKQKLFFIFFCFCKQLVYEIIYLSYSFFFFLLFGA